MPSLIKRFKDSSILEYDSGSFDNWCIYITRPNLQRYAPRDTEYFNFIKSLSNDFSAKIIYSDFVAVFNLTKKNIDNFVLNNITAMSSKYKTQALNFNIWMTTIYASMVAEENKANARLGKRIKRLGIHQVLMENIEPDIAANFSRGKNWRKLDFICREKGF